MATHVYIIDGGLLRPILVFVCGSDFGKS